MSLDVSKRDPAPAKRGCAPENAAKDVYNGTIP
jgi:hypothetical protein